MMNERINIETDIEGIIRELNLSENDVLYPFYEAIVNSIQAINEQDRSSEGKISVYIERDKRQPKIFEDYGNYPISSIRIIDNGIGFNSDNYSSFKKSHSTKKAKLGGKGLGRFAMLSVFDKIKINSIANNNLISFELSKNGMFLNKQEEKKKPNKTELTMSELNPKFSSATAKYSQEDIANAILEHCLLYYLNDNIPIIEIVEENNTINLSKRFSPENFIKYKEEQKIRNETFTLYFTNNQKIRTHEYCLCAHNRKVKGKKIETILPIFSSNIKDEDCFIQIYVVSPYLDNIVNMSRNEFKFPKPNNAEKNRVDKLEYSSRIIEKEIDDIIKKSILDKYSNIINERTISIQRKVNKFLNSDEGLEYRHLDIDENLFIEIPDDADNKKLDDILHEYQYKKSKEARKKEKSYYRKIIAIDKIIRIY